MTAIISWQNHHQLSQAQAGSYTYSLAISLVEWTLLFDLSQLHIDLLADHSHRVSTCEGQRERSGDEGYLYDNSTI